ncbi:MAG: zinc-binding dehydrogenase, partial [Planctomycetota bacterium]
RNGQERHCPHRSVLGILNRDGALAEYITLPIRNLVKVPDSIASEEAVYAEPLAAVLQIAEQAALTLSDKVVVLGDGRLGLLAANVFGTSGHDITIMGLSRSKMNRALSVSSCLLPHEAEDHAYDVAIDCTGSPSGFERALSLLKPRGRLILKTTVARRGVVDLNPLVINEITLIGSRCGSLNAAVDFLDKSTFAPSSLTSATFSLSNGLQALEAAMDPANIKVLLESSSDK